MAETWSPARVRDWFADARGPVRRMQVSHRPEDGIVVFSLWEGDRCRATFRMPATEVPRLLHDLVDVAVSTPAGTSRPVVGAAATSARERVRRALDHVARRRQQRDDASVVPFRGRRR